MQLLDQRQVAPFSQRNEFIITPFASSLSMQSSCQTLEMRCD